MPHLGLVYAQLMGWTGLGWGLGRLLPDTAPAYLGKFLFWVGVPLSIFGFLRQAELSLSLWMAPLMAWVAILSGVGLAWRFIRASSFLRNAKPQTRRSQGSFLLTSMFGNTGYIGYAVSLALVGPRYFAWALVYDFLGSTIGAYGLGVALASRFGASNRQRQLLLTLIQNPALWSFGLGLMAHNWPLPVAIEKSLQSVSWSIVSLALMLLGMRLSQLSSLQRLQPAIVSLTIKMLIVPLSLGIGLTLLKAGGVLHLSNEVQRAIVLQMAMPPAFATLVLAETYELDQELTVTTLSAGSVVLLMLLPLWMWLF